MRLVLSAIGLLTIASLRPATSLAADNVAAAREDWNVWFAEYNRSPNSPATTDDVFTMFPRRFTLGPARDSVETRLRYDTSARTIDVYAGDDGSYFVDYLPLFIPSEKRLSVSGIAFDCVAQPIAQDFEITCHTKGKAAELHAFYERGGGFTWFEYFCGYPTKICRYQYSNGQKLLNPAALQKLRKDGALRSLSERM